MSRQVIQLFRVACAALLVVAMAPLFGGVASAATQSAKALDNHGCNDTEWHFVITQLDTDEQAPAAISVTWANEDTESVPLDKVTGGTAHYATTSNLDSTVTSATADLYDGWSGQFNLSHGPCGEEEEIEDLCPGMDGVQSDAKDCDGDEGEDLCPAMDGVQTDAKDCDGDEGGEDLCPAMDGVQTDAKDCEGDEGNEGDGHTPVNVCHGTGSEKNPYVFIVVDDDSADFQGHLMHRTSPLDPRNRDYVGDYTDSEGVRHVLDGQIDGIEDCPPAPAVVAPSGSFTVPCVDTAPVVTIGSLSSGSATGGRFELVVNGAAQTVVSGQTVTVPTGATLVLQYVPTTGSPVTLQSGTSPATCTTAVVVVPAGSLTSVCTATGALVDIGTLTSGTSTGGKFELVVNGAAQTVVSGQNDIVVPASATLGLRYVPAAGSATTLDSETAPAACVQRTETIVGSTGGGDTVVEGVKTGRTPGSTPPQAAPETAVLGTQTGVLAATGASVPTGPLAALGGLLLLMGAALVKFVPRGTRS